MPEWLQILLALGGSALIGLIVADVYRVVKRSGKKYKDAIRAERQDDIKQAIAPELEEIKREQSTILKDLQATKNGIQAELRHDIRNACRRCVAQGFKTTDDLEEVAAMHLQYEKLGSNGVTNALYDEFLKLPIRAEGTSRKRKPRKKPLLEMSK